LAGTTNRAPDEERALGVQGYERTRRRDRRKPNNRIAAASESAELHGAEPELAPTLHPQPLSPDVAFSDEAAAPPETPPAPDVFDAPPEDVVPPCAAPPAPIVPPDPDAPLAPAVPAEPLDPDDPPEDVAPPVPASGGFSGGGPPPVPGWNVPN
jgi:hypothetical protein